MDAHSLIDRIEGAMRSLLPDLGRVVIHIEPLEGKEQKDKGSQMG